MKPRIFIGLNNIAGVGINLQQGFKDIGIPADFYSAEKDLHPYDYLCKTNVNKVPKHNNKYINYIYQLFFLLKISRKYSHFIYLQANWTLLNNQKDVAILKKLGKTTVVIFTGCDIRIPDEVKIYAWNPCTNCTTTFKSKVNCLAANKVNYLKNIDNYFSHIFSPDECLNNTNIKYNRIWFPRDINQFPLNIPVNVQKKIRILHAPSNSHYKGSIYVNNSINSLKKKYPEKFEFIEVKNKPISELYELIKTSDIIIDQMLVGFYGLLSVESMAMGKPVVVYVRPDIWSQIKDYCPVINANPDNLTEVLEGLISKPEELESIGLKSRKFVENYHDSKVVAKNMLSILNVST